MHLWYLPLFLTILLVRSLVYLIILKIKGRRKTIERSISTDESNIAGVRDSDPECPDNDESSRNRSQCHLTFDRWLSCPRVNTETPKTHKKEIGIERYFILWTQKITLRNLIMVDNAYTIKPLQSLIKYAYLSDLQRTRRQCCNGNI